MGKVNEKKRGQEKVLENKTGKGREKETKKRGHIQKLIYGNVIKRKNQREIKRI